MRTVARGGGDGVSEMSWFAGEKPPGRGQRRMQREHRIERAGARTLVGHRAARRREGRIARRCDDGEPVGGAALDDEDEALGRAREIGRASGWERECEYG